MSEVETIACTMVVQKACLESVLDKEARKGEGRTETLYWKGCDEALGEVKATLAEAIDIIVESKRDFCKAACATLTPLAGGLASGEDWNADMPEHAEFEEYFIQAQDTLLKDGNIGDQIKKHVDIAKEALCNK